MVFRSLIAMSSVIASLASASADAAVVYWEPTNADEHFIYSVGPDYNLGIFDVDDFNTTQTNPFILNTGASSDTVEIVAAGGDFTATSLVTTNSITLQFKAFTRGRCLS